MGLLDKFFGNNNQLPEVTTILPAPAKVEIMAGRLPILNSDALFTQKGEKIHFIDKAMTMEIKKVKSYQHMGVSSPGLFKGHRMNFGGAKPIEKEVPEFHPGILYITSQRVVLQSKDKGFDKAYKYLTAIKPYSNGIELQFGNKTYSLIMYDGNVPYQALQIIKEKRGRNY